MRPQGMTNLKLAYAFYAAHKKLFKKVETDRVVPFSADQLDDFAVARSCMARRVSDVVVTNQETEALWAGLLLQRAGVRRDIARGARKANDNFPSYSLEATDENGDRNYQIMAVDHYADTRPEAFVNKANRAMISGHKACIETATLVKNHPEIDDIIKRDCLRRLSLAEEGITKANEEIKSVIKRVSG